ncbi:MAG: universal stress protein, partial [Gemmatimonadota bacterium]|nr:universal stress protein [Gemmatimonadota bacterium]
MYQSVLVPLDGSVFGASALPVAAAFARKTGAELHLVTVYDPSAFVNFTPADVNVPLFLPGTVDERCELLRSTVVEQAASISNTGLKATGTLLEGTVVEALAEHAELTQADLVIMTTHVRVGIDRLRLGSVASSFLSRSPVPVYLVRPPSDTAPI